MRPVYTPATVIPWTVQDTFRMQPGLTRLAHPPQPHTPIAVFMHDAQALAYQKAKQEVMAWPGIQPLLGQADTQTLQAVAQAWQQQMCTMLHASNAHHLSLQLQEDFVIVHDAGQGFKLEFVSVCFPSHWRPEEKLGMDFSAIHAPVADNRLLMTGAKGIMEAAFRQHAMLRHVWLLVPDAALSQHPLRHAHARSSRWSHALMHCGKEEASLIDQIFFRVERQTTLPLPWLSRGVFFIRVMVTPLRQVLEVSSERAMQLHRALASMSDAVLAYRNMQELRAPLLHALERFTASGH